MKPTKIFLAFLLPFVLLGSCCTPRKTAAIKPTDDELKANYAKVLDVLSTIQYAIEKAYVTDPGYSAKPPKQDPDNALNHLSEISVELANSLSKKVDGEVSFWVIKAGGSHAREKASTFTYTFVPIKDETKLNALLAAKKDDVATMDKRSEDLQKALVSLGTCLKKYKNSSYDLNKLELEVSFKITNGASAGVDFKIGVVGITAGGELEWGNEDTMTLTFDLTPKESNNPQKHANAGN